jgi:hypothetical protein
MLILRVNLSLYGWRRPNTAGVKWKSSGVLSKCLETLLVVHHIVYSWGLFHYFRNVLLRHKNIFITKLSRKNQIVVFWAESGFNGNNIFDKFLVFERAPIDWIQRDSHACRCLIVFGKLCVVVRMVFTLLLARDSSILKLLYNVQLILNSWPLQVDVWAVHWRFMES